MYKLNDSLFMYIEESKMNSCKLFFPGLGSTDFDLNLLLWAFLISETKDFGEAGFCLYLLLDPWLPLTSVTVLIWAKKRKASSVKANWAKLDQLNKVLYLSQG